MKNVHDVLPHMIERRRATSSSRVSLAAHFPTPAGAGLCVVQVGDQLLCPEGATPNFRARHSVGLNLSGPVISALLAESPPEKLKETKESRSLLHPSEVANVVTFMLTRPRGMTIRDVVMLPTNFDL
jgi:ribitol 2-dehydrogenase